MNDPGIINMVDSIQTAVREILLERGYDAEVSLGKETEVEGQEGMMFSINPKGNLELTQEVFSEIIEEAFQRVGIDAERGSMDDIFEGDDYDN